MKIDLAEVNRAKVSISSSKATLQGQINDAKSSMKSIVSSGALSGKVKGAIDAKISNHQIPLLTSYYDTISSLDREFKKLIQSFKSTVKESNDHALIDSNELTQLEAKFSPKLTEFTQIETQFKNAYADISGIVAIEKASGSGFKEEMEKTKKVLTNTKTWMSSFKGSSSSIAENIARQTAQLGKLSSTSGVSYTSPEALTIFQDKAFKKHVSKEHKKAKELEKEELRARKQSTKNKGLAYAATVDGIDKSKINQVGKGINSVSGNIGKTLKKTTKKSANDYLGIVNDAGRDIFQDTAFGAVEEFGGKTAEFMFRSGTKIPGTSVSSALYAGSKAVGAVGSKIPIIGLAVDYGMQLKAGENSTDALNKTIVHFGVGAIVGLALSATPVGVAIVGGAVIATAINVGFDSLYDSSKKSKK